jgi:AraC-like DNA-binding protein
MVVQARGWRLSLICQPMSKTRQAAKAGDEHLLVRSYAVTHPRNLGLTERAYRDWDQLAYASQGVMTVVTAHGAWIIPPHRAVWIPAGVAHSVRMSGRVQVRTLFFRTRLSAGRLPRECVALNVSPLARELILYAAEKNTLKRNAPADRRLARLLVDQLEQLPGAPLQLPMPQEPRANKAARLLIEQRPGARLAEIAKLTGASVRTLERVFLKETAMTFGRWSRRARLAEALRLLAEGMSVTQVAAMVNYQTPSAFIAAFRRELGKTPRGYFGR